MRARPARARVQSKPREEFDAARRSADARPAARRPGHLRREGPRHLVPADRAAAPAGGCPERADRAARRRGLRLVERLRWTLRDPRGGAPGRERAEVQPLPHDCALLAHAPGAAHRAQPSLRRHGRHHRDRHVRAGLQLGSPEHGSASRGDAQAQRLLHRAVRQVPRGAGLGDEPAGAVRRLAHRRRRLRALLRLHRRRDQPVRAGAVRRHDPDRAGPHPGGGLPPHRGHDRPRDRLGAPAEGADARQAVLRLLRAGGHACAAPRADRVVGQVQGPLRRGLGRAARGDLRAAAGARRDPARGRADRQAGGDPGVGRHAGRPQAGARATDGGLRGLHGAHGPSRRPPRSTRSRTWRSSTTRSSTTSSATTAPRPRERRRARSTR